MIAKVCDRCGKIFGAIDEHSEQVVLAIPPKYKVGRLDMFDGKNRVDICPDCIEDFCKWLKGENNGTEKEN